MHKPHEVVIGSDHAAYRLKERIKNHLASLDIPFSDIGAVNETSIDYSDIGIRLATAVSRGDFPRGILMCGTGIGMSMVANRFAGVRAALCGDLFSAIMSRRHNNANVLVMGGRMIGEDLALAMVDAWLATAFDGDRHQRRIERFERLGQVELEKTEQPL